MRLLLKFKGEDDFSYRRFITSTPIVLFENNRDNKYYSLKNNGDFSFFLERVKENALKKYNAYYGEDYSALKLTE
ncbi:MAG: CRISPR-associated endoribonuclease Cas6 [Methanobacterium sp.]|jgi:CRISPR-associated endoribonuclease Cas6